MEAEGVFADGREQYLLSALCRLYILYLSSKGGGSMDEMAAWVSYPPAVQMRLPTEDELKKMEEKKVENDKKAYKGLIALATGIVTGNGKKIKTISRKEYNKKYGYE